MEVSMSAIRSIIVAAAALATAGFATSLPAQAQDADFYIGPNGARIYIDDDRYRSCHNEVSYTWRYRAQYRVVDRVCYDRWGNRYVADHDVDRVHRGYYLYDD